MLQTKVVEKIKTHKAPECYVIRTLAVLLYLRPAVFTIKRSVFRGFLKRSLAGKWLSLLTLQTREIWRMFVRGWM